MSQAKRVRVYRGVKRPPGVVYVGRPSVWANPFSTARAFREWLATGRFDVAEIVDKRLAGLGLDELGDVLDGRRAYILANVERLLRGRDLGCWCELTPEGAEDWCHGDVLRELANRG